VNPFTDKTIPGNYAEAHEVVKHAVSRIVPDVANSTLIYTRIGCDASHLDHHLCGHGGSR
jgi:hypothetical protein